MQGFLGVFRNKQTRLIGALIKKELMSELHYSEENRAAVNSTKIAGKRTTKGSKKRPPLVELQQNSGLPQAEMKGNVICVLCNNHKAFKYRI